VRFRISSAGPQAREAGGPHPRYRSRLASDGFCYRRCGCRSRPRRRVGHHQNRRRAQRAFATYLRRGRRHRGEACAGGDCDRKHLRPSQRRQRVEARAGSGRGVVRDLSSTPADLRVFTSPHQEGGGRPRRRGKAAGAAYGEAAARVTRGAAGGRRRRARRGALPCILADRQGPARDSGGRDVIGFLTGTLVSKRPPSLTIEVAGIGYEIDAPMSTFYKLPEIGKPLTLVTHLSIREDAHILYGFFTESERALFRSLLKVTGVGARIALGVLSGMS